MLRLQRQLAGHKLLIIDELGYVPLSQTGAELLFEVFSQRYERGSTVVTSNLPFDEWTSVFGSERVQRIARWFHGGKNSAPDMLPGLFSVGGFYWNADVMPDLKFAGWTFAPALFNLANPRCKRRPKYPCRY